MIRGAADSQEACFCRCVGEYIRIRVAECSAYDDVRIPSIHDMAHTAWILTTDKAKKKIGFEKASDWVRANRGSILPPDIDDGL